MTREALIKHWDVIQAFKEGKQIQWSRKGCNRWRDTNNPNFGLDDIIEFRVVKNKNTTKQYKKCKEFIEISYDGKIWKEFDGHFPACELQIRARYVAESKKRLPTIEEVEKWFMGNRVFRYKNTDSFVRINRILKSSFEPICITCWLSIDQFCKEYTHLDGSELYITE